MYNISRISVKSEVVMHLNLLAHEPTCSPDIPCRACKGISLLREALAPEQFAIFAEQVIPQGFEPTPDPHGLTRFIKDACCNLHHRIIFRLEQAGIVTLRQLVSKTEFELLTISGFGRKSLNEVKESLARLGLHLGWYS
jgi:hypothetical protein